MPGMKRDCGGAAGILGAFYLAVKQGFSQNLHAVLCLAENAVSDVATRPDDIHTLYSGQYLSIFKPQFLVQVFIGKEEKLFENCISSWLFMNLKKRFHSGFVPSLS